MEFYKLVNRHLYKKYGKNIQDIFLFQELHIYKRVNCLNHLSAQAMTASSEIWALSLNHLQTYLIKAYSTEMGLKL